MPQVPSPMELRVLPSKLVVEAKLYRSQGHFNTVQKYLEECLPALLPQDANRYQVICSLADVYCDLGLPENADALVTPEIIFQRGSGTRSKALRRLLVSAIDADLGRGLYDSAESMVEEVETIYTTLSNLDVSDQLLHVRTLVASARIHHYKSQFPE